MDEPATLAPPLVADTSNLYKPTIVYKSPVNYWIVLLTVILIILIIITIYVLNMVITRPTKYKNKNLGSTQLIDGPEMYYLENGTLADYEYAMGLRKPFDNPNTILKKAPNEDLLYAQLRQ
jgi:hypothetical protein